MAFPSFREGGTPDAASILPRDLKAAWRSAAVLAPRLVEPTRAASAFCHSPAAYRVRTSFIVQTLLVATDISTTHIYTHVVE